MESASKPPSEQVSVDTLDEPLKLAAWIGMIPAKRQGGVKVSSVEELVAKLKTEARII